MKEATKIVAEFMGQEFIDYDENCIPQTSDCTIYDKVTGMMYTGNHYESLDNLVPVWETLNLTGIKIGDSYGINQVSLTKNIESSIWSDGETIQKAALLATAKAIKEINER